ncbi:MAG: ABC transporter substrate-binding protein, partial [Gammaproteobacteria bacterium]|nr:ABC transporter substrate-binding protein [Gammaproteobacteria bacterium]
MTLPLRAAGLLALLGVLAGRALATQPIVLTDAGQRELRFDAPPRRIVSLLPSLTESVCELGECARLVATDSFSNWPQQVRSLPKAGGIEDVELEQVVQAKPDVVLLARAPRALDRLRSLGIVTVEFDVNTYRDIASNITTLGVLLDVPERARSLNARIERSIADIAAQARGRLAGRSPLVYYEVDTGPYGAGPDSFIGEELKRLGARNILTPDLGPFPKLNPEYIVRANPDVILISPDEAPHLVQRPGWSEIRAVREQ